MAKKRLYLASSNQHKRKEMQQILPDYEIRIPNDDGIEFNPTENGSSFYENSLIKARALWELVHEPVIADDSGICVEALGGEPGIFTSRYAGPNFMHGKPDGSKISQDEQNRFLIEQLNDSKSENRNCHYTCAMVLLLNPDRFFVAQETFEGTLINSIEEQAGTGGTFLVPSRERTGGFRGSTAYAPDVYGVCGGVGHRTRLYGVEQHTAHAPREDGVSCHAPRAG